MWSGTRPFGVALVAVATIVGACASGGSSGSTTSATSAGPITVVDDRGSQRCAPDDSGEGTFDEPTYPAPTIEGVEVFTGVAYSHVEGCVDYAQNPPVGGKHWAVWQACRFYDRAIPPEQGVHSMQHGSVWITYDPGLSVAERRTLAGLARDFVLVSPWNRDPLPSPIVASAWGLQLRLESTADPRLAQFIAAYADGPQNPEPGAPCQQNGSTTTL